MRRLIAIFLVGLNLVAAGTTVQTNSSNLTCSNTSGDCSIGVTATTIGNTGVMCGLSNTTGLVPGTGITSPTNGGTWTLVNSENTTNTVTCYKTKYTSSVTTITIGLPGNQNTGRNAWYGEFLPSAGNDFTVLAQSMTLPGNVGNTPGPTLSLGGNTVMLFEMIGNSGAVTASSCTHAVLSGTPTVSRGVSVCDNVSSSTMNWTNTGSAGIVLSAIALQEVPAGGGSVTKGGLFITGSVLEQVWNFLWSGHAPRYV